MSIVKIDNMDESFYSKLQNNPFMLNAYRNHFDLGTFVQLYYNTDMRSSTAIVMGTESTGLTEIWRKAADAHIRIPMLGMLDSLNVSVSAAILLFEALRQRNG